MTTQLIQTTPLRGTHVQSRFIRQPEVLARVGVSWMTLVRWEKQGRFPKRRKIGPNTVAWLETEIDNWCAEQTTDPVNTKAGS